MKLEKKCAELLTELTEHITPEIILKADTIIKQVTPEKISEMESQGYSVTEIAKELGVSRQYLYKIRKKNNLAISKRGRKSEVDRNQLLMLHAQGFTDAVIAENMGISRTRVVRIRKELGLASNFKVGERGPGKLRDNIPYLFEVRRVLRDPKAAKIIRMAAKSFRDQGGEEEVAWAATLIEPGTVYHPDPGSYCTLAENTNLSHVKYAVELENRQDFAGLCGLPSIQLVEKALECRSIEVSEIEALMPSLTELVAYSGYMGTHTTTGQVRLSNLDSVHTWINLWDKQMEDSKSWAPVKKESRKRVRSFSIKATISNGKKGKQGGYQNIQARQAYSGASGY